jgi:hypothetical protein
MLIGNIDMRDWDNVAFLIQVIDFIDKNLNSCEIFWFFFWRGSLPLLLFST